MRNETTIAVGSAVLAALLAAAGCGGRDGQGADSASADPGGAADDGAAAGPAAGAGGAACSADADCVPAECCHPRTCVHRDSAPDCRDMMCTMDCQPGTMDCGGGRCLCRGGKCEAEIFPPKEPRILSDPPPPAIPG